MGITAVSDDPVDDWSIDNKPIMLQWARNLLHDWFVNKRGYTNTLPPDYEYEVEMFLEYYWKIYGKDAQRNSS